MDMLRIYGGRLPIYRRSEYKSPLQYYSHFFIILRCLLPTLVKKSLGCIERESTTTTYIVAQGLLLSIIIMFERERISIIQKSGFLN